MQLDLAIVAHANDLSNLQLLLRSIARFSGAIFNNIFIVLQSEKADGKFLIRVQQLVAQSQAALACPIFTLPQAMVAKIPVGTQGWDAQQILKLEIAKYVQAPHYVVLDAKNHFINCPSEDAFMRQGKPRIRMTNNRSHEPRLMGTRFKAAFGYFGINAEEHFPYSVGPTTPFTFSTALVRELIDHVESGEAASFPEKFIEKQFAEFYLYNAFLVWRDRDVGQAHFAEKATASENIIIWGGDLQNDPEYFARTTASDCVNCAMTFAIHKTAVGQLNFEQKDLISKLWRRRGLMSESESIAYFNEFRKK